MTVPVETNSASLQVVVVSSSSSNTLPSAMALWLFSRRGTRNRLPAIIIIFVIFDELVGCSAVDGFDLQFDLLPLSLLGTVLGRFAVPFPLALLLLLLLVVLVVVKVEGAVALGPPPLLLLLVVPPPNEWVP